MFPKLSPEEKEKLRKSLKVEIQALLCPEKYPIPAHQLQKAYRSETTQHIPYVKLGFSNLEDLLWSMPDVVSCRLDPDGILHVKAVPQANSAHINEFVQGQRKAKKSTKKKPSFTHHFNKQHNFRPFPFSKPFIQPSWSALQTKSTNTFPVKTSQFVWKASQQASKTNPPTQMGVQQASRSYPPVQVGVQQASKPNPPIQVGAQLASKPIQVSAQQSNRPNPPSQIGAQQVQNKPKPFYQTGYRPLAGTMFDPPGTLQNRPLRTVQLPQVVRESQPMRPQGSTTPVEERPKEQLDVVVQPVAKVPEPPTKPEVEPVIKIVRTITPEPPKVPPKENEEPDETIQRKKEGIRIIRTISAPFEELFPGRPAPVEVVQAGRHPDEVKFIRTLNGQTAHSYLTPPSSPELIGIRPAVRWISSPPPPLEPQSPPPVARRLFRPASGSYMEKLRHLAEKDRLGIIKEWHYQLKNGRYVARVVLNEQLFGTYPKDFGNIAEAYEDAARKAYVHFQTSSSRMKPSSPLD